MNETQVHVYHIDRKRKTSSKSVLRISYLISYSIVASKLRLYYSTIRLEFCNIVVSIV